MTNIVPPEWVWLLEIAVGILIVSILSLFFRKSIGIIDKRLGAGRGISWAKNIKRITHLPIQIAIWGFGFAYVLEVLLTKVGFTSFIRYVHPLKAGFIIGCMGWMGLRWNHYAFKRLAKKAEKFGVNPSTFYALSKLCSFVITVLTLLIIFQIFGLNIGPLLAFGGIGVAGIAFAAQDMIANFFGGAMLHFTRAFSIGDEVVIPSQNNFEGEVKEIGWYITKIEDYYRRPVYFPNALFSKACVINESRRTHRRMKETFIIRYEDLPHLEKIIQEIREKIGAHPGVDNTQSFSVTFSKLGEYGLEIYAYLLIHKMGYTKFLRVKEEIFFLVQEAVYKFGAEFAYPTHMQYIKGEIDK